MIGSHDEKPEWLKKNKLQITAVIIVFDQSQVSSTYFFLGGGGVVSWCLEFDLALSIFF